MRQKFLYTRYASEISGLFSLEKRRVFKENTPITPENSPENFSEKDVLRNLSLLSLKNTLNKQQKISREKIKALKKKMHIEAVKNIISKNIKTLSVSQLMMAEEIFPGLLKKMFIKEDGKVDFQGNRKAEQVLGLGDMLPLEKTHIVVFDARSGKYEYGVRGIKNTSLGPRPAYINMETGKYIEILQNYEVLETVGDASPIPQPSEKKFQAVKNRLNPHEAIFDKKVRNKKGKIVNTKEDIAKNMETQKNWLTRLVDPNAKEQSDQLKKKKKITVNGVSTEVLSKKNEPSIASLKKITFEGSNRRSNPEDFLEALYPLAKAVENRFGIPYQLILAMAAQESGWLKNNFAKRRRNGIFNITGKEGYHSSGFMHRADTNGKGKVISQNFLIYNSLYDAFMGYGEYLTTAKKGKGLRYPGIGKVKTPEQAVKIIAQNGYAQDPNYEKSLLALMRGRLNSPNFKKFVKNHS